MQPAWAQPGTARAEQAKADAEKKTGNNPVRPSASVPGRLEGRSVVASGVFGCDQVFGSDVGAAYDRHRRENRARGPQTQTLE
ncbi:hypothetical protein Mkiyose1088_24110 [Mycobacterium kiyosense]|uniref:Uncharacterized protein n=1 Tax=Mycobacterium kiyosense TaxID=2871094 RepID=A0A9P3QCU1_9MYCO|nr:hypothetical protein IWGMT90018_26100 [Mycobacterium kiyosense]BDE14558.1 hypothetical protein MKCMC460_34180 [Mycobacterium sp. 20KCMC460]GLB92613.1 hypothetical protein SRL2020130_54300 [Mycobacterium kiyosense]GLC10805.1 hypothetical protein SRL2020411_54510 [Mycobacterium kiyosense]GLC16760.1 hypothetical protein SRL2020448_53630 [Mycobacterium kiyosense]